MDLRSERRGRPADQVPKQLGQGKSAAVKHRGKEGNDVARWLNTIGVAGIVLKYRLPRTEGHVYGHEIPLIDAQRAIQTLRANADQWNIDPSRVGVIGFSAGGHLCSTVSNHFAETDESSADPIARTSSRPDFAILAYPVIGLDKP